MRQPTPLSVLPEPVIRAAKEFVALFDTWPLGKRAVSIGGSIGKGNFDAHSDIDLRLWYERDLPARDGAPELWRPFDELLRRHAARGLVIDGVWMRKIGDIDARLRQWVAGQGYTEDLVWSVWGYHLPVDVFNQCIVQDPDGVLAEWRRMLTPYPPALRKAVLAHSLEFLHYWRNDYHYQNKIRRRDAVFLASLTAKLVHHVMQILFALNGEYFVGDGANLAFAERFALKPTDLTARVTAILYPDPADAPDVFVRQSEMLAGLIDEVTATAHAAEAGL